MKVLLDSCVWGKAVVVLAAEGHDVDWAGNWEQDPGDEAILRAAHREGRVLVTLDKDFGQLAVAFGHPHSGIVRLVGLSATDQGPASVQVLDRYGEELEAGAVVTVDVGRVRVRRDT